MSREFYESYGLDYELTLSSPLATQSLVLNLIVIELNQYEDMFGPFMRMEVVINDSMGLLDKFPLVGDETLTFKYKNPNGANFNQIYLVYKVSGRQGIKDRAQVYTLHAISQPGHTNSLESVYAPFIEKKPHEIVETVFKNYMFDLQKIDINAPIGGGKRLRIPEVTDNPYTVVATGQNPLKLINQVTKEARSTKYPNPSTYVFYESSDSFYFTPLPWFYEQEIKYEFFLSVPKEEEQMIEGKGAFPARSIANIKFLDSFDNIDQAHRGVYYNEVNVIDPILKRFKVHPLKKPDKKKFQFDYKKNWDELKHLPNSGKKFVSEQGPLGKTKKAYSSHRRLLLSQIEEDNENYPVDSSAYFKEMQPIKSGDQLNAPRKRESFLAKSVHELNNLNTNVIEITTPGIPEIFVGNLIKIKVPQPTQIDDETNKFLFLYGQEATFLITAIRLNYVTSADTYTTVLSCSKESLGIEPKGKKFDNDQGTS